MGLLQSRYNSSLEGMKVRDIGRGQLISDHELQMTRPESHSNSKI